ncbi:HTH-type sugar sensing transcriptional regulator TrmBL1 [uncultured archaeon]|nr:HTH-type sugar sensing transcriptional regulator TrmBL1 [uncultured archaeon]
MKESIVEGLKKIGLTEYEAKAYAALVGLGEATARDIHDASGVPRTRIYDILRDLTNKGFVEFVEGSPTYYRVVDPDLVMERIRDEFVEAIDKSKKELRNLNLEVYGSSPIWCVRSEWGIKNRIRDFLAKADTGKLTIFCRNPAFLREYRSDLKRRKATILVDDLSKFKGSGLELKEMKKHFAEQFNDTTVEGVTFRVDCILINTGKESLIISYMGGEKLAIIIKMPMISMIQESFLELSI